MVLVGEKFPARRGRGDKDMGIDTAGFIGGSNVMHVPGGYVDEQLDLASEWIWSDMSQEAKSAFIRGAYATLNPTS